MNAMTILPNRFATIIIVWAIFGCSRKYGDMLTHISFDEFSLSNTECKWIELAYPHDSEVAIINSNKELAEYITESEKSSTLSIDFSQYTLLLARGVTIYDNRATIKNLQRLPNRNYVMDVDLVPGLAAVITNWQVAIVTSKLDADAQVQLHIRME